MHPVWVLLLLTGTMAFVAASVDEETYGEAWVVRKFLGADATTLLFIYLGLMAVGMLFASGMAARGGSATLTITPRQGRYLRRTYKTLFFLTALGYLMFFTFAFQQGVGFSDLLAVLQRDEAAAFRVKSQVQTVAGLTTMTQFGPLAVALGFFLRKVGLAKRGFWFLVFLSLLRVVFYTERLALIETLVPLILVAALTVRPRSRAARRMAIAPLFIVPVVWCVFAASEYLRSWVYYQHTTDMPFAKWVSLRMFGYYTTGFNNSALFMDAHQSLSDPVPFYSVGVFWNAPGLDALMEHPGFQGFKPESWWPMILRSYGNPEFNNEGSFLVVHAEFGPLLAGAFWLGVGLFMGWLFAKISRGSLPALMAYSTLLIGILELPRFVYWSQGRATPVIVALLILAIGYPRIRKTNRMRGYPVRP